MGLLEVTHISEPQHRAVIDSSELANFLKAGPSRPILDRILRIASEVTGLDFVSFGIRNSEYYFFISIYGIPFNSYIDKVEINSNYNEIFTTKFELMDLKKVKNFKPLSKVPISFDFRYCANIPIKTTIPFADGGSFVLSAAGLKPGEAKSDTLTKLSQFAALIADSIWLMVQMHDVSSPKHKVALTANILLEGLRQSHAPICIVDSEGRVIDFSPGYAEYQNKFVKSGPERLQSVADVWMDRPARDKFKRALKEERNLLNFVAYPDAAHSPIMFDFFTLSFPQNDLRVGVFSIHMKCADPDWRPPTELREERLPFAEKPAEADGVVSDFLFKTLQRRQKLSQRGGQSYLTVRAWRKSIKEHQIAALRALKQHIPDCFVSTIAEEMAETIRGIYGDAIIGAVTAVPCGHTGPGCLADKIASALSVKLGVPYHPVFECLDVKGSSHPKTNVRRPAMRLIDTLTCPVVLVDDVVTSGSHIEEAAKRLKIHAPAVWPIAWISD